MRRSILFGTVTNVPQGRVLTAEEEYGALNSASLLAEEDYVDEIDLDDEDEFGALNSSSLFAEEEYVDDAEFGALNSSSLFAEEEYVDDAEFGALNSSSLFAEEEYVDDAEFGALNSSSLFAEEEYVDDIDDYEDEDMDLEAMGAYGAADPEANLAAAVAELDAEVDADMSFGAYYGRGPLRVPSEAQNDVASLSDALNLGAMMPMWAQTGLGSYVVQPPIEYLNSLVTGNETREIAKYLMLQPGFASWNSLSPQERANMVHNAVYQAALPGIEMQFDDPVRDAFASGAVWDRVVMYPKALWNFWTGDFPRLVGATLTEIGIPVTDDQIINGTAIRYLAIGYWMPQIYDWLADAVTRDAQDAIQGMQQATQDLGPVMGPGPMAPSMPVLQPPPIAVPSGSGFPTPAQVLGFGTAVIVSGAMLGVFK